MQPSDKPKLSIVIPAKNEKERLPKTIAALQAWIAQLPLTTEIIPVIQGHDQTARWIEEIAAQDRQIRPLLDLDGTGKGRAVKQGCLQAQGDFILFIDADMSVPTQSLEKLLKEMIAEPHYDMIIGSRYLAKSTILHYQSLLRRILSRVFNQLLHCWKLTRFQDTQCGCKLFRRNKVASLFPQIEIEGFAFDIELLFRAQEAGLTILEFPICWENKSNSSLSLSLHGWRAIIDAYKLYQYARRSQKNHL